MIKFKDPGSERVMIDTLQLIARGVNNDLSGNPFEWSSTMAYLALGGRIENGEKLDDVKDLCAKLGYEIDDS